MGRSRIITLVLSIALPIFTGGLVWAHIKSWRRRRKVKPYAGIIDGRITVFYFLVFLTGLFIFMYYSLSHSQYEEPVIKTLLIELSALSLPVTWIVTSIIDHREGIKSEEWIKNEEIVYRKDTDIDTHRYDFTQLTDGELAERRNEILKHIADYDQQLPYEGILEECNALENEMERRGL